MGVEPGLLIGFRSADNIRASGRVPREQAGDMTCTRPQQCIRFFLQSGRRPDMALTGKAQMEHFTTAFGGRPVV